MGLVRILAISAVVMLALGAGLVTQTDAASKCVKAGGQGTGLGEQVAKSMADEALATSIKSYGGKGSGKVSYACNTALVITTCTATQRACK
jgi:hypothetical protein